MYAGGAILAVHLAYLLLLASASDLQSALPAPAAPVQDPYSEFYNPPNWQWSQAVGAMLPWNLPLVPALADLIVLGLMLHWSAWTATGYRRSVLSPRLRLLGESGPAILAFLLPLAVVLSPDEAGLGQRKVVVYNQGVLDWDTPTYDAYGRQSAGVYGVMPLLVEAIDGQFAQSDRLAAEDLRDTRLLVLLHPDRKWPKEQLERVWRFVRDGGSLLVVTGPGAIEDETAGTVNQILEPCAMRVRFDTAIPATLSWQSALDVMAHPATSGIGDDRNHFGFMLGSSIRTSWPARPLLVGRYGWSDPGPDAALNLSEHLDAGEPLGDVVLAAQQPLGKGTVAVLADPYGLMNEGYVDAFGFTSRLLSSLAAQSPGPQDGWRQALGMVVGVLVVGLVFWRPDPSQAALVAVAMGVSLAVAQAASGSIHTVLPDGRSWEPNPVAYIDASHLEAYSDVNWAPDGLAGLKLTLMRNGYLPLAAPDLSSARLQRASLLISIAPARAFTEAERRTIRDFVYGGGVFITMVGASEAGPSQPLLADFGFHVPTATQPAIGQNPQYERQFRAQYPDQQFLGGHACFVRFHAVWPIQCLASDTRVIARDFDSRPVLAIRTFGKGKVVVIGDTGFALNKNLENVDGQPFEGGYENAHFWRWLLTNLQGQPAWIPPPPPDEAQGASAAKSGGADAAVQPAQRSEKKP